MTIDDICAYCRNYFLIDDNSKHFDNFVISGGLISPVDFLKNGQYFKIVGSILNDGVYQFTGNKIDELKDETFNGSIWEMAVPNDFLKLFNEILAYTTKYADTIASPYSSESFEGYSNSVKSDGGTWQEVFKSKLNRYRRLRV